MIFDKLFKLKCLGLCMEVKLRKAKYLDIEMIEMIYVVNCVDEVKERFPEKKDEEIFESFRSKKNERMKYFEETINSEDSIYFVAEVDNNVVGFGEGFVKKNEGEILGIIEKVYINNNYRSKGIGKKIVEKLMDFLKFKGVDFFEWRCYSSNTSSLKLAKSFGFETFSIGLRKINQDK